MNDQELLTYAAKAINKDVEWDDDLHSMINYCFDEWNPLLNDADAFQLMVKLNLFVCVEDHEVEVFQSMSQETLSGESLPDPKGKDFVVRKCIVVAAAEIGKGM